MSSSSASVIFEIRQFVLIIGHEGAPRKDVLTGASIDSTCGCVSVLAARLLKILVHGGGIPRSKPVGCHTATLAIMSI